MSQHIRARREVLWASAATTSAGILFQVSLPEPAVQSLAFGTSHARISHVGMETWWQWAPRILQRTSTKKFYSFIVIYYVLIDIISKCYWHSSDQTAPRSGASDSGLKFGSVMSCVTGSGVGQASSAVQETSFGEVLAGKALGEMLCFW